MSAAALLARIEATGVVATLDAEGRVRLAPASRLPPALLEEARRERDALARLLAERGKSTSNNRASSVISVTERHGVTTADSALVPAGDAGEADRQTTSPAQAAGTTAPAVPEPDPVRGRERAAPAVQDAVPRRRSMPWQRCGTCGGTEWWEPAYPAAPWRCAAYHPVDAGFLARAAEAAHAALAASDPDLARERAATAMAQAAEAAGAFGQTRPEADHQAALAGFQTAAMLRPPAWSDHASIPPPGACCTCCKGQRWWSPRDPRADGTGPGPGWRCTTCRPPSPGVAVTVLDTAPCRRRPRFAAQGSTR